MEMVRKPIAILNLIGELPSELGDYFARKEIIVVDPEKNSSIYEWTHILTKNLPAFAFLNNSYNTVENDIRIISLSQVDDLEEFAEANGKLIFNEQWMSNALGEFILDKFFQEYGGVALNDSYPTFTEKGSFQITNPFNTGEYLDRMVYSAFMDGVNALQIKTYFDHLVMYLSGLKAKGKLGLPIEVTYGFYGNVFGMQLHFFTQDLVLEDVTSSLTSRINRQSEKYLLNIAVQSTDFFDFTLLKEVNKTVITGLWTKDEDFKNESRGLLFTSLSAQASLTHYQTEGVTSFLTSNPDIQDFSEQVIVSATTEEESVSTVVSGGLDFEESTEVVSGGHDNIKGKPAIIHGTRVEDEIIQLVKGKIEEEEKVIRISGSKEFDVDKFAFRVTSGIEAKATGKEVVKIKSLKNELPDAIKESFHEFTLRINKSLNEVTEKDLEDFKEIEVPKIIKLKTKEVDNKFKDSHKEEKIADIKTKGLMAENENLKSKIKTLMTEIKILKESKTQMAEIHQKAVQAAVEATANHLVNGPDDAMKAQILQKMNEQRTLNEDDTKKLAELLERERKFLKEARENDLRNKKLQIEFSQKEAFFSQEMENLNRQVKAKDLIVIKSKESFTKLIQKKDDEIRSLNEKLNQAAKALASSPATMQAIHIKELERKIVNYEKLIEIHKNQMSQKPQARIESDNSKEELRRMNMLNTQLKNQLASAKRELTKFQDRIAQDSNALKNLKQEKVKLEQLLKKAALEARKEEVSQTQSNYEQEIKKLTSQCEMYDNQLKESLNRQKELEMKLNEALRATKKESAVEDAATKGKTAHLENNVRKLTQDLVESRNQLAEMKKETNKLRQEKTALQNQLDKIKKEADKSKAIAAKKPGMGGKAA